MKVGIFQGAIFEAVIRNFDRLTCNLKRRVTFGIAKSCADAPKRAFWRSEGHHQCPTIIHIISRTLTTGEISINPD